MRDGQCSAPSPASSPLDLGDNTPQLLRNTDLQYAECRPPGLREDTQLSQSSPLVIQSGLLGASVYLFEPQCDNQRQSQHDPIQQSTIDNKRDIAELVATLLES
jgi:hypothetical protein